MSLSQKTGRVDKPYRAPPERGSIEDLRRALDRTNERIDALNRRLNYVEQLLDDNSIWVDPA
jgi:predicted RNase H-like nuclease (RuvC/YqgF family)